MLYIDVIIVEILIVMRGLLIGVGYNTILCHLAINYMNNYEKGLKWWRSYVAAEARLFTSGIIISSALS